MTGSREPNLCLCEFAFTSSGLMVGREGSKRRATRRRVDMSSLGRRECRCLRWRGMMEGCVCVYGVSIFALKSIS